MEILKWHFVFLLSRVHPHTKNDCVKVKPSGTGTLINRVKKELLMYHVMSILTQINK